MNTNKRIKISIKNNNNKINNHRGLDLRRKIILAFAVISILFSVVTFLLVFGLIDTRDQYNFFIESIIRKKSVIKGMNISMLEARRSEKDFFSSFRS